MPLIFALYHPHHLIMPASEHLSDDYVAQLLAKDAKISNAKYSAYGLQDVLPRR